MEKNEEIIVKIEKVVHGGKGLARYGNDNLVVLVCGALPDEELKVKITNINKHYAQAEIVEIIKPSKHRIKPLCALYNACGSCDFMYLDYDYSVDLKTEVIKEMFSKYTDNILPVIKCDNPMGYRHKIQFPARETKNSKRVLLGYFKNNSHDLTNIKFCMVQQEIINKIAQYIRDNYVLGCYNEKTKKGLLKNVLMRINKAHDSILITFVLNCEENNFKDNIENGIFRFFKKLSSEFKEIKGFFVNFNPKNTNNILGNKTIKVLGEDFILENLGKKTYKIGSTSFFQVNPESAEKLFDVVANNIEENGTILDAYGGVGAIGIYVSDKASKITLVEENANAIQMAKENFELNKIQNYEILEGDAKKHFNDFEKAKHTFDYVILDPPRSGVYEEALNSISKLAKNIIYVSCNVATLRRDTEKLLDLGFEIKMIQGVDLFPYTHHIETVIAFTRKK